ncbi:hypothetical protein GQF01_12155 [Paenibacillus sp. 5J-6]|uniref:Uncharacterized protein n=1 Tax=Paenibacillus silvestris TaxID=2606219 RepID=A0A6L8UY33_9BACL|nr:hypothetical protein [Paenibacillus silvestris]MZQ82857.1 hypothetical protein [Paenibacillus silvestris]
MDKIQSKHWFEGSISDSIGRNPMKVGNRASTAPNIAVTLDFVQCNVQSRHVVTDFIGNHPTRLRRLLPP